MTGETGQLPTGYEALEPFVADWALPTLMERAHKRNVSTPAEKQALYEAARGIVVQALGALDATPLQNLDEREQRLLAVLLSYSQVALSIEVRLEGESIHAQDRRHMVYTRQPSGFLA